MAEGNRLILGARDFQGRHPRDSVAYRFGAGPIEFRVSAHNRPSSPPGGQVQIGLIRNATLLLFGNIVHHGIIPFWDYMYALQISGAYF